MKQIVLSIEQMKHLEELGLKVGYDASMVYHKESDGWHLSIFYGYEDFELRKIEYVPAYTLQDILEKLPKAIPCSIPGLLYYRLSISSIYESDKLAISYEANRPIPEQGETYKVESVAKIIIDTPLEATYKMLCWCLEEGFVK